jgi:hypothetical protein
MCPGGTIRVYEKVKNHLVSLRHMKDGIVLRFCLMRQPKNGHLVSEDSHYDNSLATRHLGQFLLYCHHVQGFLNNEQTVATEYRTKPESIKCRQPPQVECLLEAPANFTNGILIV